MFEQYCIRYHRSIISSKILLKPYLKFPKIKKVVVFFILNTIYYKKKILLFFVIINLCFYKCNVSYTQEINNYQILKFFLKKKVNEFFNNFVTMYLPIFDLNKNVIKKSALNFNKKLSNFYRITYLNFPVIPESEILCYNNQQVYN
jgi:hypothetical protein